MRASNSISRQSLLAIAVFLILITTSYSVFAAPDDELSADYTSYDSIVEDLQKQTAKQPGSIGTRRSVVNTSNSSSKDPFENVWIHAGVGFAQTTSSLELPNGSGAYLAGRGVQAAVGIDILGPHLAAEGAVRSFGESEDASNKITLKEFDLKVLFKTRFSRIGLRAGGGLSARYMTVRTLAETFDVTTPASVITLGGDIYLAPTVSFGLDLSTRNAMISETFDRASIDGTIRLDTHF